MRYIPITPEIESEMLNKMGISSLEELIKIIPDSLRLKDELGLNDPLSELELLNRSKAISNSNDEASNGINFLGGGAYDHFIPSVVDFLSGRSEFYTAYTPYQAEVSQGTLQVMYEFQSMICELSGMDVANSSLYDGASAVAEACSMSLSVTRRKKVFLSGLLNPAYIQVVETYLQNRQAEIVILPNKNGRTDLCSINFDEDDIACIVIQSPNYYGIIEDWWEAAEKLKGKKGLLVAVGNPLDMVLLKSPGESGAHIYVGEGQALGNPISFGGPHMGLMATRSNLMRKMPGRIAGKTTDIDGKEGFVLTIQTREQHIRRENATSNICTNQALLALRSTIYLSLLGKENIHSLVKLCFDKAHYLAEKITDIAGFGIPFGTEFIKEFVVSTPISAKRLVEDACEEGIFFSTVDGDDSDRLILIAVTEKRTKEDMDQFIKYLKKYRVN